LSGDLKLGEIVVVLVLGYVKDEWTFSMLAFTKDKLRNRLGPHLDTIICMFAQKFYIQGNLFNQKAITTWNDQKVWIGVTK
jgi:hypothetical protein